MPCHYHCIGRPLMTEAIHSPRVCAYFSHFTVYSSIPMLSHKGIFHEGKERKSAWLQEGTRRLDEGYTMVYRRGKPPNSTEKRGGSTLITGCTLILRAVSREYSRRDPSIMRNIILVSVHWPQEDPLPIKLSFLS